MDWDDSYDEEWDNASGYENGDHHQDTDILGGSNDGLDPTNISDPASAYFFLSDDAQDEIEGTGKRRMKCLSCGHRFVGNTFDSCPKCESFLTEEAF